MEPEIRVIEQFPAGELLKTVTFVFAVVEVYPAESTTVSEIVCDVAGHSPRPALIGA
jgi:hypothetical protein